jgi:hypothetical protein
MRLVPPPYPPAVDETTEPGLGAMALRLENARLLAENSRLRTERNDARLERDELRASDATLVSFPPPTPGQRRRKAMVVGGALGTGAGLLVVARVVLRAVADRWPEYAPVADFLISLMGG